ncbi:uncharacterized protein BDV14DRAFT_175568 [Aspergillus stella-maris]|uniref:uncharacterized protein n=1 Tax=Aspergillus stella-maris TaxID=1810926 RepID=UPI003CCD4B27
MCHFGLLHLYSSASRTPLVVTTLIGPHEQCHARLESSILSSSNPQESGPSISCNMVKNNRVALWYPCEWLNMTDFERPR